MSLSILEWRDENSSSNWPLKKDINFKSLIVDASFVQFDGFVPRLNSILVSLTDLKIELTVDSGTRTFSYLKSSYNSKVTQLNLYDNLDNINKRYIGTIVFGVDADMLWANYINQKITFNISFEESTVRVVPKASAVYTIQGKFGDLLFKNTDAVVFYNTDFASNSLTFNAVTNHRFPEDLPPPALKKLNLMTPINNNVFLSSNDVIKITNSGDGYLQISLVSTANATRPVLPTLSS